MCKKIVNREEVRRKCDEEARRRREQWPVKKENEEGTVTEFCDEPGILAWIPVVFLDIRINNHQIL